MVQARFTCLARLILAVVFLAGCATVTRGQQLTITSPPGGAVYSAGQTVNVTVSVAGGPVSAVQVGVQDIGSTAYQTTSPFSFTLTVPSETIGSKNLFAVGLVANETVIVSPVISIDVEPSVPPAAISFQQGLMAFGYVDSNEESV